MSWVYRQMSAGMDPRTVIKQIIPHETLIPDLDDLTLWKLIINIMCEPPPRSKLSHINTLADVLNLMRTCKNIVVLTGAGVCECSEICSLSTLKWRAFLKSKCQSTHSICFG